MLTIDRRLGAGPDRLGRILEDWRGTRYSLFSQSPGGATDCVRFVAAVGDELLGRPYTKVPREMSDAAMHRPERARSVMRWLMRAFDYRRVDTNLLLPADVLVTGPRAGGPGHAMIVGHDLHIWHCTQATGVTCTGVGGFDGMILHAILRRSKGWN